MVEANQVLTWALVVTALALQIIKSMALQSRSNDRKECSIHTDLFNTGMIRIKTGVLKTLLVQPSADRARLWCRQR